MSAITDIGLLIQMRRQSKAARRGTYDIDRLLVRLRCQQIKRELREEGYGAGTRKHVRKVPRPHSWHYRQSATNDIRNTDHQTPPLLKIMWTSVVDIRSECGTLR